MEGGILFVLQEQEKTIKKTEFKTDFHWEFNGITYSLGQNIPEGQLPVECCGNVGQSMVPAETSEEVQGDA